MLVTFYRAIYQNTDGSCFGCEVARSHSEAMRLAKKKFLGDAVFYRMETWEAWERD